MALLVNPPNPGQPFVNTNSGLSVTAMGFLTTIVRALNGATTARGVAQVLLGNSVTVSSGMGTPNGVASGNLGDLYLNRAGGAGATLWVKETGALGSNTGWTAK